MKDTKNMIDAGLSLIERYGATPLNKVPKSEYDEGGAMYNFLMVSGCSKDTFKLLKESVNVCDRPTASLVLEVSKSITLSFIEMCEFMANQERKAARKMPPSMMN